jgi:hypothetical protein
MQLFGNSTKNPRTDERRVNFRRVVVRAHLAGAGARDRVASHAASNATGVDLI